MDQNGSDFSLRGNLTPDPLPLQADPHPRRGRRSLSRKRARVIRYSGDIEGEPRKGARPFPPRNRESFRENLLRQELAEVAGEVGGFFFGDEVAAVGD